MENTRHPKIISISPRPNVERHIRRKNNPTYVGLNKRRAEMILQQKLGRNPFKEAHSLKQSYSGGDAEPAEPITKIFLDQKDESNQMEVLFQRPGPFLPDSLENFSARGTHDRSRFTSHQTPQFKSEDKSAYPPEQPEECSIENDHNTGFRDDDDGHSKDIEAVSTEYIILTKPHSNETEDDDYPDSVMELEEDVNEVATAEDVDDHFYCSEPNQIRQRQLEMPTVPMEKCNNRLDIPATLLMKPEGSTFKGTLLIENKSLMYYAFMMKTNIPGKHYYSAIPTHGSIPPCSSRSIEIIVPDQNYTNLLAEQDRLIVIGFSTHKCLRGTVLTDFLKAMYIRHPTAGDRVLVKPTLEERIRSKNQISRKIQLNQIVNDIHAAKLFLRDISAKIRDQRNEKMNFMVILIIIIFVCVFGSCLENSASSKDINSDARKSYFHY